jgi:peptide deformylase
MARREILTYPNPTLATPSQPVRNIDGRVAELVRDMAETMYAAPGIGLAAPQVGVNERVIVVDVTTEEPGKHLLQLVNPVVVEAEGTIVFEEGCLSVRNFTAEVQRARKVLVRAFTLDEKEVEIEAEDLLAVALQHEIDHLDGKLFIDRIGRLRRDLYRRKLKRWLREGFPEERAQDSVAGL